VSQTPEQRFANALAHLAEGRRISEYPGQLCGMQRDLYDAALFLDWILCRNWPNVGTVRGNLNGSKQ
jgi:hypothetical protein